MLCVPAEPGQLQPGSCSWYLHLQGILLGGFTCNPALRVWVFALCLCYCTCRRHRPCMSHFPRSCLSTGQVPLTVCCCTNTELTFPLLDKPDWVTFSLCRNSWFHLTVPAPPCTHRLSPQQVTEPAFPRKGHMQQESFITYLVIKEALENCHLIITCSAPP